MKTSALSILLLAAPPDTLHGIGLARARILVPEEHAPAPFNPVTDFSDLAVKWVLNSERGPTTSGHFMVHVAAALFDAYAAFEEGTTGAVADLDGDGIRVDSDASSNNAATNLEGARLIAMVDAAHAVITTLGRTLLNQTYLEIENGEDASERLPLLLAEADALRNVARGEANLDSGMEQVAMGVSNAVASAILTKVEGDGSNYANDYADTSGYKVKPWISPVPVITDPRTDYNFLDGSWVEKFNTYDAIEAHSAPNSGFAQINPKVASGDVRLTTTYQSLTEMGIFPPDADGGQQKPLTAHWGNVTPLSLHNSSELRTPVFGPYDENGDLNMKWVDEAREVVEVACLQQATNCPRCRAESEYWELGDEFPYPPGWWVKRATDIARAEEMDLEDALKLIFGVTVTVFDAGIAAWEMKYYYDTVRPVTTINEIFEGSTVCDWRDNQTANIDDKDHWRPYQLRRNTVPPFPDIPSGHSAFSTSASVVLRNLLGTNVFDYRTEPFKSRFDLTRGFDGDETNGNEYTTLDFQTFSQAADAAGFSRLYGGIHMMQGNVLGLEMGARVGHMTLAYLRNLFGEDTLGEDPVADVWSNIVFGSGGDDDLLVAPCSSDGSPVEVYGFYGDDVLEFSGDPDYCGPGDPGLYCGAVSLFGGDGEDTFIIGVKASIRDYEARDTIVLLQEEGIISTIVNGTTTTILVDGVVAVHLDGVWSEDELKMNIEFRKAPISTFSGDCTYQNFVDNLVSGCDVDDLPFPVDVTPMEYIMDACELDAPTQFVEIQGTYQEDRRYFAGGSNLVDGEHFIIESGRIKRFEDNMASNTLIGFPNYFARLKYNIEKGYGENGYPANMNLETSCDLNTIMCCFTDDSVSDTFASNGDAITDVLYHDLHDSPESNHIKGGWAGFHNGETSAHCVGFTWSTPEEELLLGNMMYDISLRNTATKGYRAGIPGSPMCGCVEHMAVVESASCRTAVNDTAIEYKFYIEEGMVRASNEATITYKDCDNADLATQFKANNAGDEVRKALIDEHLPGANSAKAAEDHLNENYFVRAATGDHPTRYHFPNPVKWSELFVGEGIYFLPAALNFAETDTEFRALVMAGCKEADGIADRPCIVRRICPSCVSVPHRDIYYKRKTPLFPVGTTHPSDGQEVYFLDMFMNNWFKEPANDMAQGDFELYSSYQDALEGTDAWTYCTYQTDRDNYGFPRNCGPHDHFHEWNSHKRHGGHAEHHGFFVERP